MNMKHKLLIVSVISGSLFLLGGCGYNKNNSLVVFNYGDYLDPSIIDSFEKETGIKILYEEYQSPEEMYMKYKADIVDYDVICSSDYILEKLRTEDELLPINFDNIPNAANVDEHLWEFSKTFDPENKYTIPPYATEYNDDLAYVVPKEGSNVWVDSWAVTKDCKNTENAEKFLNYLLRVDISKISFEYNHYGTPNKKLAEILPAKYTEDPALFPPSAVLDNCEIFRSLDRGTQDYYSKLWKEIKLD